MAKEILSISEQYLDEVIQIIRHGLDDFKRHHVHINSEVKERLEKWCNEEEEYLRTIREDTS